MNIQTHSEYPRKINQTPSGWSTLLTGKVEYYPKKLVNGLRR